MFWRAEGIGYGLVPQMALAAAIVLLLVGSFCDRFRGAADRLPGAPPGSSASRVVSSAGETPGNARGRVLFAAVGEHLQRSS